MLAQGKGCLTFVYPACSGKVCEIEHGVWVLRGSVSFLKAKESVLFNSVEFCSLEESCVRGLPQLVTPVSACGVQGGGVGPKLRGGKSCPLSRPSAHNSQAPLEGSFGLDVGAPERWGHAVDEELGKLKRPRSLQVNEKQTPR